MARVGEEKQFGDYVAVVKRGWPVVLLFAAVLGALAWWYASTRSDTYEAVAAVAIGSSGNTNIGYLTRELQNVERLANADVVRERVEAEVGSLPDVRIVASGDTDIIEFLGRASNPEAAAFAANAWADALIEQRRDDAFQRTERRSQVLRDRLTALALERRVLREEVDDLLIQAERATDPIPSANLTAQANRIEASLAPQLNAITTEETVIVEQLTLLRLDEDTLANSAYVASRAAPPLEPSNGTWLQAATLGALLGALLGGTVLVVRDTLDTKVNSEQDLEDLTGLPVLASIPLARNTSSKAALSALLDPESGTAEAFHKLRTSLQFLALNQDFHRIMITSANAGEGKTTTANNLAWALASTSERVGLLDLDLRRPEIHNIYGFQNNIGTATAIMSQQQLSDVAFRVDVSDRHLLVVPSGALPPNPAELLASPEVSSWFKAIDESLDLVVVDTPPVNPVSDSLSLALHVQAVVMVVRARQTSTADVSMALEALRRSGANVVGTVLVGTTATSGYGTYRPGADETERTVRFKRASLDFPETATNGATGESTTSSAAGTAKQGVRTRSPDPRWGKSRRDTGS